MWTPHNEAPCSYNFRESDESSYAETWIWTCSACEEMIFHEHEHKVKECVINVKTIFNLKKLMKHHQEIQNVKKWIFMRKWWNIFCYNVKKVTLIKGAIFLANPMLVLVRFSIPPPLYPIATWVLITFGYQAVELESMHYYLVKIYPLQAVAYSQWYLIPCMATPWLGIVGKKYGL